MQRRDGQKTYGIEKYLVAWVMRTRRDVSMGLLGAFLLFFLFILVYIMIAEIFTVLFRLTGLTEEKAKFQVISLLTNSGYTTQESEIIVNSKIRRKLASITMIFGYAFTVTIVASVVNIFFALTLSQLSHVISGIVILAVFIVVILGMQRSKWLKDRFDEKIEQIGNRIMFGEKSNPVIIIDTYGGAVMAEVYLTNLPSDFENTMLKNTMLKQKYNIVVLLIKREDTVIENVMAETILCKNDTVVVFGAREDIRVVFENVESMEDATGFGDEKYSTND